MNRLIIVVLICLQFIACKKKETDDNLKNNFDTNGAVVISQSVFTSNAHPTSGSVKLYLKNGEKNLVFENFKTDSGPDLRVYISKSTSNSEFIDVGTLKATSGNFYYTINNSINTMEYKHVLIWCEDFSVLFGSAQF